MWDEIIIASNRFSMFVSHKNFLSIWFYNDKRYVKWLLEKVAMVSRKKTHKMIQMFPKVAYILFYN